MSGTVVGVPLSGGPTATAEAKEATASVAPDCGGTLPKAGGGTWTCTFTENFEGTELDRDTWVPQRTALSGYTTLARDCYFDSPANIRVRGGALHLIAQRHQPFECKSPGGSFTSTYTGASVSTWGNFAQTYGRFEMRAAFPRSTVAGLHSALWLYPQSHSYGAWPASGEIDIAEYFTANPDRAYPTVHYATDRPWYERSGWQCYVDRPDTFHTYAVEWTAQEMRFLYDGKNCWSHRWAPQFPLSAPQPFDKPFQLVMTQALGGGHNAVSPETELPGETLVDWVRVWK